MEARELRIGNYIYDDFNEVHRVESIESEDFNEYNGMGEPKVIFSKINGAKGFYQCDEVSPIPLTEEWLLKFGFENNNGFWSLKNIDILDFKLNKDYIIIFNENPVNSGISGRKLIKFIHQLQNLFFSLCGEELNVK